MDGYSKPTNSFYVAVAVVVIGLYMIYRAIFPSSPVKPIVRPKDAIHGKAKPIPGSKAFSNLVKNANPAKEPNPKSKSENEKVIPVNPIAKVSINQFNEFKKKAHFEMPLPPGLLFHELDLSDDLAAISGTNGPSGVKITILAKANNYSPSQVAEFLMENGHGLPGFNEKIAERLKSDPEHGQLIPGSGLSSPVLWRAETNNTITTIAFVNRNDGRGAYLILLSGPTSYFDANEDLYDKLYSEMKAIP